MCLETPLYFDLWGDSLPLAAEVSAFCGEDLAIFALLPALETARFPGLPPSRSGNSGTGNAVGKASACSLFSSRSRGPSDLAWNSSGGAAWRNSEAPYSDAPANSMWSSASVP